MNIDRIKVIYDQISKCEIKLEPDPRALGPLYLQNTIAECRNYLNIVSRFQLEVHREKQNLSRDLHAREAEFAVASSDLLVNDDRCKRGPSIKDREAVANAILRESLSIIQNLKGQIQDLEFVEKAIRHRHRELTSTMTEIKLQRSLIRDEMDSGAMYGDERKGDHERPGKGPLGLGDGGINEEELDALLNQEQEGAKALPEIPVAPEPSPTEVLVPPTEEAVRAFLDAPSTAESDEFADVLAGV